MPNWVCVLARCGFYPGQRPTLWCWRARRGGRFAGHWLTVAEAIAQGPLQVAIATAHGDPRGVSLRDVALAHAPGGAVVLAGEPDSVPLLADRPLIYDAPAAYVCRGYVCDRPVSSTDELVVALERR